MFISSLHNIKSKHFKKRRIWKRVKGIFFAFDAFGKWSDHDRSKMKWRMKIGIEWKLGMADWQKNGGRSATFSLLSLHHLPL
jgi:hypothetical protein